MYSWAVTFHKNLTSLSCAHGRLSTFSHLNLFFVEIGNKPLMGVTPADFAKQVLIMLFPGSLPNKMECVQHRYPVLTLQQEIFELHLLTDL